MTDLASGESKVLGLYLLGKRFALISIRMSFPLVDAFNTSGGGKDIAELLIQSQPICRSHHKKDHADDCDDSPKDERR